MDAVLARLKQFGRFWSDFVIGDDWTIAAAVAVALGATYGIRRGGVPAWWLMPLAGVAILAVSVVRRARRS